MKKMILFILLCLAVAFMPALAEEDAPVEASENEVIEEKVSEAPEEEIYPEASLAEELPVAEDIPVVEDVPLYDDEVPQPDGAGEPVYEASHLEDAQDPAETAPQTEPVEDAPEAWLYFDEKVIAGKLQDIAENLSGNEIVYVSTEKLIHLRDVPLYVLAGVKFRPDYEVFPENCCVTLYYEKPSDDGSVYPTDLSDAQIGQYGDLYVRVELIVDSQSAEPAYYAEESDSSQGEPEEAVSIGVEPSDFPDEWQTRRPEFHLSGITRDSGWNYAVLDSENRFIPLSGNTYSPDTEGNFKLKFVIQDSLGDIRAVSPTVKFRLDCTAPTLSVTYAEDTIDISATDAASGVEALSLDGGESWMAFENGETFRLTDSAPVTLEAGMIRVRDAAGNVEKSSEAYALEPQIEIKGDEPSDGEPDDTGEETGDETIRITVVPASFPAGVWQTTQPEFTLTGIPEESENWKYAVLIYDQGLIPISESPYTLEHEGKRKLQFVIQDDKGAFRAMSPIIEVWGDWNPPEVTVTASEEKDYTLEITATDAGSGVAAISFDAGKTWRAWTPENEETPYTYTAKQAATLKKGMLMVRDAAGNIFTSAEDYELKKAEKESDDDDDDKDDDSDDDSDDDKDDDSDDSSSSSSDKKTNLPHAASNGADASPYTLTLTLPNEPMRQLVVGGKVLDLTLTVESEGQRTPTSFMGRFTRWMAFGEATSKLPPDTLLLSAELDLGLADAFNCEWHFNGEVYRLLGDAGIKYIVFRVGDDYCALATEGFTGGTKYTEFKMLGVSTRKFDYTLTMKLDQDINHMSALTENDFSEDCDLAVSVVVENMSYALSNSPKSLMYYYNIYLGPEDMLQFPFGKYEP